MQMIHCPNCQKLTGYKRQIGFGTFFAVLLTAGLWLLAIPFYPKRCITCGLTKGDSVPWYRTWRVAALPVVLIAVLSVLIDKVHERFNQLAPIIKVPDHDNPPTSELPISPAKTRKTTSLPHSTPVDTHIYEVAEIRSEFLENEPRASVIHKGKIMFVKGVSGKLFTNRDTGDHVVMVHDQQAHQSFVACRMTNNDLAILAERNDPGTIVVLSGECRGMIDGTLFFKRCKLEEVVR
jgi:hypothetical protein